MFLDAVVPLPAGPLVFDTGIYIRFSRRESFLWLGEDTRVFQRAILTAVVAAELYAGTRDHRGKRAQGHFSSPNAAAWIDTGILLRRARRAFGRMDFVHQFRDLLIAMDAVRTGATLATENLGDFERWKSLLASARKTLNLFEPSQN